MIEVKDLELVVKEQLPGKLLTNAIEIKAFVENKIADYTPENYIGRVDLAKADRAVLNTSAKTLDGKRLELEKEFMKPFLPLKTLLNDTVKIIKGASSKLDEIVKEEEEREKEEKREKIKQYFIVQKFTLLPFERMLNTRWLNKTVKGKEWKNELDAVIAKIYEDIKTIEAYGIDTDVLKPIYLDTLDIGLTIQKGNQLKAHREALAIEAKERAEREATEKHKAAELTLKAEIIEDRQSEETESVINFATGEITDVDPVIEITLRFKGKKSKMFALKKWMVDNSVEYEKV